MPRVKKTSAEKLNDSINVPVNINFKKRWEKRANTQGVKPTKMAREVLQEHLIKVESAQPSLV